MTKQLTIAAMFLGTGLLLGSGVAILQLWTRSSSAEERVGELGRDLEAAEEAARSKQLQVREVSASRTDLQMGLDKAEQEREQLRTENFRLRVQNEELRKTADKAEALSHEVVDLKSQLAETNLQSEGARSDGLVRVRKTESATKLTAPKYDEGGWKSVAGSQTVAKP